VDNETKTIGIFSRSSMTLAQQERKLSFNEKISEEEEHNSDDVHQQEINVRQVHINNNQF
jgi:hypothetical protein